MIKHERMKRIMIYVLALLVTVGISYLLRVFMGLSTHLWSLLVPNVVGLGSVWLYFRIKGNKI